MLVLAIEVVDCVSEIGGYVDKRIGRQVVGM